MLQNLRLVICELVTCFICQLFAQGFTEELVVRPNQRSKGRMKNEEKRRGTTARGKPDMRWKFRKTTSFVFETKTGEDDRPACFQAQRSR